MLSVVFADQDVLLEFAPIQSDKLDYHHEKSSSWFSWAQSSTYNQSFHRTRLYYPDGCSIGQDCAIVMPSYIIIGLSDSLKINQTNLNYIKKAPKSVAQQACTIIWLSIPK
jgi:hypothetical protein